MFGLDKHGHSVLQCQFSKFAGFMEQHPALGHAAKVKTFQVLIDLIVHDLFVLVGYLSAKYSLPLMFACASGNRVDSSSLSRPAHLLSMRFLMKG